MSDSVNQLEKLAALKERGAITAEEFETQKGELFKRGRAKVKMTLGRKIGYAFAILFLVAWFGRRDVSATIDTTPLCDSAAVKEKALILGNEQIPAPFANLGMRISGLLNVKELHYDKDTGFRACVADTKMNHDNGSIGYTVEWRDQESGTYLVKYISAAALIDQYAQQPTVGPATAAKQIDTTAPVSTPAPAPTPAPEQSIAQVKPESNHVASDEDRPESCVDGRMKEYDEHASADGSAKVNRKDAEEYARQKCEAGG